MTSDLTGRIRREIRADGPITFARFMELALYDPRDGYYSAGSRRLGPQGDFFTASDAGHAFGRCMARQLAEIDEQAGPFDPFHVLEFGSGRGLLGRDILDSAAEASEGWASRLRYVMVDRSLAMRDAAAAQVPEARVVAPEELEAGHRGCVIAVELFDALPVHRLRRRDDRLLEIFVDVDDGGQLVEREYPPTALAAELAERYGAAAEEGAEAEVAPGLDSQLEAMANVLTRGVLIIVDYGYSASELYGRERRRGTLLAYHRNATSEQYLERVGEQDLTAHVNFTALEDRARELGLTVLGRTTQDRFLIANGLTEVFEPSADESRNDPARIKQRLQAMQLIHPSGMGRIFKVLLLAKGCDPAPELAGLRDPFA